MIDTDNSNEGLQQSAGEKTSTPAPVSVPSAQRISRADHMLWMRDISTQIREHYEQKTGNKLSKPTSMALFTSDMGKWFSSRQKEQAETANLAALDPEPFDPNLTNENGDSEP